jgi:hypothetical protein
VNKERDILQYKNGNVLISKKDTKNGSVESLINEGQKQAVNPSRLKGVLFYPADDPI